MNELSEAIKKVIADLETQDVGWVDGAIEHAISVLKTRLWEINNQDKMFQIGREEMIISIERKTENDK